MMKYIFPIVRTLYSMIFLMTLLLNYSRLKTSFSAFTGKESLSLLTPFALTASIAAALSISLGYKVKLMAPFIVLILMPVTLFAHAFWSETDPMLIRVHQSEFLKNISIVCGALFLSYFGAGPYSIDSRNRLKALSKAPDSLKHISKNDKKEHLPTVISNINAEQNIPEELQPEHFWQNEENPREVIVQFSAQDLNKAKKYIKRSLKKSSPVQEKVANNT
jgi:putative oxidoreductase